MPLDPIVSLAVAVAEAPGCCAFLVGSGISRDAGVPTGMEVFWRAVGDLYKVEEKTSEVPDLEALKRWLESKERTDLGYSGILELFDQGTRRDYVANLFEGVEPGPTHRLLAEMAVRGWVRVFVTTNFDRLLENALRARGIEPIVVSSDDELARATRREHARCFILKPHGDYQQMTIRNTPSELSDLEVGVSAELGEIVDRYGLVVLGYSGSDEAVANTIRKRTSRYGLWWVSRTDPAPAANALIEAAGGRVIRRDGAESFLSDLIQRIEVLDSHPTGITPEVVHDEVLALLRRRDEVGLDTILRRERDSLEEGSRVVAELTPAGSNAAAAQALRAVLMPIAERRLASLIPLVLHDAERFRDEMTAFMDVIGRQLRQSGHLEYLNAASWIAWWCSYTTGALALRERRWTALRTVLDAVFLNWSEQPQYAIARSGDTGRLLGSTVPPPPGQVWLAPDFTFAYRIVSETPWLRDRYPTFVKLQGEPEHSFAEFSVVAGIAMGLREITVAAYWSTYDESIRRLLLRLHHDSDFRSQVAAVVGVDPGNFAETASTALELGARVGGYPPHLAPRPLLMRGRD